MSVGPRILDLGRRAYPEVLDAMRAFTAQRGADTPDELWLVEHDPIFTLGLAGRAEHVLAAGDIPLVKVERGGQVTYHGPGQAVVYVLLDLHRAGLTVRGLVNRLEQATIDLLATEGVPAVRREGMPGVYLAEDFAGAGHPLAHAKIASLGLKVSRGCTFHGIALNVAMDLAPFLRIDPCGYAGLTVADLAAAHAALGDPRPLDFAAVARAFAATVAESVIVAST